MKWIYSISHFLRDALKRYIKISYSLYGRVVYIITILSVFLFVAFGVIFRSVNDNYMKNVYDQCGYRIGFLVEGSLYHSMLENDKTMLQNNLEIINTLPGIDDIHLYDHLNNLVYSSSPIDSLPQSTANCKSCHDVPTLFHPTEKSSRILSSKTACEMLKIDNPYRYLFINSPILNHKSCYTNECHHHQADEVVLGSLIIKIPLKDLDAALEESTKDYFLLATLMTLMLLTILIFFTRKKIKYPLEEIVKASERVGKGDLSTRLKIPYNQLDDISKVSNAFNNMLDSLHSATIELQNWSHQLEYKVRKKSEELEEAHQELLHVERMASLGKLSSSVAHEINNPLTGVLTYTKLVQKLLENQLKTSNLKESVLKHLKMVETETKRCGDIVKGLLDFSRKDQQNFEEKDLNKIVNETFDLMTHSMKIANIGFSKDLSAKSDTIYCSPNQIKQACVAILQNASEAVQENGEIIMKTDNPDNNTIRLIISDNGMGIRQEDIPHIFEPFFSAKERENSIGLGLAIVHGIVTNHQGKIEVSSTLGKGTTIIITFPLYTSKKD